MNFVIFHCPETYNLLRVASITVQNFSPCDCEKPLKGWPSNLVAICEDWTLHLAWFYL